MVMTGEQKREEELRPRQKLILENRESLTVTGVRDVSEFSEREVILDTNLGGLVISGENLKIQKLDLEGGVLSCEGKISGLGYRKKTEKKRFLEALFR